MPISNVVRRIQQSVDAKLAQQLTAEVTNIAEAARSNASWSSTIPNAIKTGSAIKDANGDWIMQLILDLNEAPQAAAFEFGSGIRATKGEKKTYPIVGNPLAFTWLYPSPLGLKFLVPRDEFVKFNKVMHPGVAPKPYLHPAINKHKRTMGQKLLGAFMRGYREATPRVVIIKAEI